MHELRAAELSETTRDGVDPPALVAFLAGVDRRPRDHRPPAAADLRRHLRDLERRAERERLADRARRRDDRGPDLLEDRVRDEHRPVRRIRESGVDDALLVIRRARLVNGLRRARPDHHPQHGPPMAAVLGPRRRRPPTAPARERAYATRPPRAELLLREQVPLRVDRRQPRSAVASRDSARACSATAR